MRICESLFWLYSCSLRLWLLLVVQSHFISVHVLYFHFFGIVCLHHCHCRLSSMSHFQERDFPTLARGDLVAEGTVWCAVNWKENVHSKTNNMCTIYSWYGSRVLLIQTDRNEEKNTHTLWNEWLFIVAVILHYLRAPRWFIHMILKHI